MERRCPYCDQTLPEFRLGVRLPPLKARIFDLVLRGGKDGIPSDDLRALAYNGNAPNGKGIRAERGHKTLGSHIQQINELLEDTGYRIICSSHSYRLERRVRI